MRKTALFACLSMLATAVGAQTSTTDKFANQSDRGLKIVLLPPSPQTHEPLRYRLSEPAYVAAFMVYPGSGVRQLYPLVDAPERLQRAGYNVNELIGRSFDDDSYRVVLGPSVGGPSYLYVIASRHPLDVAQYVHRPMRLASTIGEVDARSFYASVAFDALVNNAISVGDDQSWDADVYVVWPPDPLYRQRRTVDQYRLIVCSNGVARAVPYNYPFNGCAGDLRVRADNTAPKPVVQKTAMAPAAAVAPVTSGGAARYAGRLDAPTVLPTIIGKRMAEAERGGLVPRDGGSKPVMYTVANGDQAVPVSSVKVAPGVQIETMDGAYAHRTPRDRGDVDGRANDRRRPVERDGQVVGGSPQLAPNPKLAPNPGLSPAHAAAPAPRNEGQQRNVRESMRVPPPQQSAPREPPPTAKP
ncbi:MAG: hypothetical protein ABI311_12670 [Gemmatimonadaceae bacterium]